MSIISQQINEKIKQKTLEYLKKGEVPGNMLILKEIKDFLKKVGAPSMEYRPFGKNSQFDIESFNMSIDEIKFDIEILYKELIDHFKNVLSSYHVSQEVYEITSNDLNKLLNILNEELLLLKNGDDNFNIFIEDFSDLDKTNQLLTTNKAVDVDSKSFSLPVSNQSNFRISSSHLSNIQSWAVNITSGQPIISNSPTVGAGFGNAFSDIISPWRQVIRTGQAGELKATFIFPIAAPAEREKEVLVNQIVIKPHADYPFMLSVLKSVDNVNWTYLPGYSNPITIYKESSALNLNFQTELIQYLRFDITIPEANTQISETEWEYIFGFKNISYYQLGRSSNAVYVSKPFETKNNIGKVVIDVVDVVPAGTSADYFIGIPDLSGNVSGEWQKIKPLNSVINSHAPNIIRFNEINERSISYIAPETGVIYDTHKAINFYSLNSGNPISEDIVYSTAQLERGENLWSRDSVEEKEEFSLQNIYVDFTSSDVQNLYLIETENLSPLGTSGQNSIYIQLNNSILYNPENGDIKAPPPSIDPNFDHSPRYAIYEASWVRQSRLKTLTLTGVRNTFFNFPTGIIPDKEERPRITLTKITTSGGSTSFPDKLLRESVDYTIRVQEGIPTIYGVYAESDENSFWRQRINESSSLDFYMEYYEEDSLLDRISSIDPNLNRVNIYVPYSSFNTSDYIRIKYRAIPKSPDFKIFPTSIKAKKEFNSNVTDYILGQDYTVDLRNGKIYRIANGQILPNASIYLDFKYEKKIFETQTFGLWCYVNRTDLPEIPISIEIDTTFGESFILNNLSDRKTIDISNLGKIPRLGRGWYQFIIKSKNPDLYVNNLINKVISLKDLSGNIVFQSNNFYFNKVIGGIEPLRQVSLDYLKRSVLSSNNNYFAIDENGIIVLNFEPNNGNGFYPYYFDSGDNSIKTIKERFTLTYQNQDFIQLNNKVIVKIELLRNPAIDGGITPEVKSYNLRIGP